MHPLSMSDLQTESRNVRSSNVDIASTYEMCRIINDEDSTVAGSVGQCLEEIAAVIDSIADRVKENGRVIYIGAGTSGRRLGVLDASEIPPTFSAPYSQFIGIIAGGDTAIRTAVEGAEDSPNLAVQDLQALDPPLSGRDTIIGIATSGRTPYVLGGLSYAHELGIPTVGICLTGSTRLKAGTATKMILNMISTGAMIRIGKTYGNLMVDVKPSNVKLSDRARRIFRAVFPNTALSDSQIDALIKSCGGNVKLALVAEHHKCSILDAVKFLNGAGGVLKRVLELSDFQEENSSMQGRASLNRLVLCIDAGGTKCKAVIANKAGILSQGEGGPCNFVTLGHDVALSALSRAVLDALVHLPSNFAKFALTPALPPKNHVFAAAWIGGAGLDRGADLASIRLRIVALLNLSNPETLLVTNDAALLSSVISVQAEASLETPTTGGIVLVTGTGTIGHSFALSTDAKSSLPKPINRSSGWGYLLGDEGSAFAIGRDAVRAALDQCDRGLPPTALHLAITKYFGCQTVGELISAVYLNVPPILKEDQDPSSIDPDPKLRVAGVCQVVFSHAFPSNANESSDPEAVEIVQRAAASAANVVISLLSRDSGIELATSALVFGGALAQVEAYRKIIIDILEIKSYRFARIEHVLNAAGAGVQILIRDFLA